jgi:GAF domain-containing protein
MCAGVKGRAVDPTAATGGGAELAGLSSDFGELAARILPSEGVLTPSRLVLAAQQGAPHVDAAGLTVLPARARPETTAATAVLARRADEIQYATGQGPCLDAARGDDLVRVDDLARERRWPAFSPRVVSELGIRSMICLRLELSGDTRAALNFYAARPRALDDEDAATGAIFASFVALALEAQRARQQVTQLETALQSSRQIGTAMGILMARGMLTSDQAFAQLRNSSQLLNRKLRDVALDVVETGELPDLPRRGTGGTA